MHFSVKYRNGNAFPNLTAASDSGDEYGEQSIYTAGGYTEL